jgi:hypothetical protein
MSAIERNNDSSTASTTIIDCWGKKTANVIVTRIALFCLEINPRSLQFRSNMSPVNTTWRAALKSDQSKNAQTDVLINLIARVLTGVPENLSLGLLDTYAPFEDRVQFEHGYAEFGGPGRKSVGIYDRNGTRLIDFPAQGFCPISRTSFLAVSRRKSILPDQTRYQTVTSTALYSIKEEQGKFAVEEQANSSSTSFRSPSERAYGDIVKATLAPGAPGSVLLASLGERIHSIVRVDLSNPSKPTELLNPVQYTMWSAMHGNMYYDSEKTSLKALVFKNKDYERAWSYTFGVGEEFSHGQLLVNARWVVCGTTNLNTWKPYIHVIDARNGPKDGQPHLKTLMKGSFEQYAFQGPDVLINLLNGHGLHLPSRKEITFPPINFPYEAIKGKTPLTLRFRPNFEAVVHASLPPDEFDRSRSAYYRIDSSKQPEKEPPLETEED